MAIAIAGIVLSALSFLVNTFVILVGAVWFLAPLKTEIKHLAGAMRNLTDWLKGTDSKVDDHAERIARLEAAKE